MSDSLENDFLLKEYEFVKTEIKSSVEEINVLARYAIIFCGGVLGFIFAKEGAGIKGKYASLLLWLPFGLALLLSLRSYFLGKRIDILGKYIKGVETLLFKNKEIHPVGWEHYLENDINNTKLTIGKIKINRNGLQLATFLFYVLILIVTLLIPLFFRTEMPDCIRN